MAMPGPYVYWNTVELRLLAELYPRAPRGEIEAALPRHTWQAIQTQARKRSVYKIKKTPWRWRRTIEREAATHV